MVLPMVLPMELPMVLPMELPTVLPMEPHTVLLMARPTDIQLLMEPHTVLPMVLPMEPHTALLMELLMARPTDIQLLMGIPLPTVTLIRIRLLRLRQHFPQRRVHRKEMQDRLPCHGLLPEGTQTQMIGSACILSGLVDMWTGSTTPWH